MTSTNIYPEGSVLGIWAYGGFPTCDSLTVRLTFNTHIAAELPMWVIED